MTVITEVYASPRSACRASTISRTSTGRSHSHKRSMITASSSPKRLILTPEPGMPTARPPLSTITHRTAPRFRLSVNIVNLLSVLVDMAAITDIVPDGLGGDPDAAIRQLYSHYAKALHGYVDQFCPDRASADDIVQETFIRAWHHLPQLSADDRPVRPWLYRVARNLLTDANRAARSRPMIVPGQADGEVATDSGLEEIL